MNPAFGLARAILGLRAVAKEAARADEVEVNLPGHVAITAYSRAALATTERLFLRRPEGTFYSEQLARYRLLARRREIKEAWEAGGSKVGHSCVLREAPHRAQDISADRTALLND